MTVTLVLGGARSGKSRYAEGLAQGERHYIATAQSFDAEMTLRIAQHQQQRGPGWITHEEVFDLATRLEALNKRGNFILVDCLTLWLSNLMLADRDVATAVQGLLSTLENNVADVVFVSNEVGMGLVPETPLGRAFRDQQGKFNQQIASVADRVVFVAAGLPLALKATLPASQAKPT